MSPSEADDCPSAFFSSLSTCRKGRHPALPPSLSLSLSLGRVSICNCILRYESLPRNNEAATRPTGEALALVPRINQFLHARERRYVVVIYFALARCEPRPRLVALMAFGSIFPRKDVPI